MTRNVLESLIIILIALTVGTLLSMPKYNEFKGERVKAEEKKMELRNQREYFKQLEKISNELKNYSTNLDKIKTALPSHPAAPNVANFLQSASSQSGLILKNLTYGHSAAGGHVTTDKSALAVQQYEISLGLSGSYPAFKDFLTRIERSSRMIEIQDISFMCTAAENEEKAAVTASANKSAETVSENGEGGEEEGEEGGKPEKTYEFNLKLKTHYY